MRRMGWLALHLMLVSACGGQRSSTLDQTSPLDAGERIPVGARALVERLPVRAVRGAETWSPTLAAHPRWNVTFGESADAPTRLALAENAASAIEIRSLDAEPLPASIEGGMRTWPHAARSADRVQQAEPGRIEELWVLHDRSAPHTLRWQLSTSGELSTFERRGEYVAALDRRGEVRFASMPMKAWDAHGASLPVHMELVPTASGSEMRASVEPVTTDRYPIVVDPLWTVASASMTQKRSTDITPFRVFEFAGGILFAVGGEPDPGFTGNSTLTDRYDPVLGAWSAGAAMPTGHGYDYILVQSKQTVVVAGGYNGTFATLTSIYNAASNTWSRPSGATIIQPRSGAIGVTLADDRVLMVGGGNRGSTSYYTGEIYDPSTQTWSPAGTSRFAKGRLALLADGSVLFLGAVTKGVDRFYPSTNSWTAMADALEYLDGPGVVGLPRVGSGPTRALVVGGTVDPAAPFSTSYAITDVTRVVEIFDGDANTWTRAAAPASPPSFSTQLTVLSSGKVLRAGAQTASASPPARLSNVELYDPTANKWAGLGVLADGARSDHVQLQTSSGTTFVIGGNLDVGGQTNSLEQLTLTALGKACSGPAECGSGFCVDSVCCDSACGSACSSCNLPGKAGTCSPVDGAPDPHGLCKSGPCSQLNCSAGKCGAKAAGTACGVVPASCTSATYSPGSVCDGSSPACAVGASAPCAGNLKCASSSACLTSCTSDVDCVVGTCDTASGHCVTASDAGVDSGDGSVPDAATDASSADAPADTDASDATIAPDASGFDAASFDGGSSISGTYKKCSGPSDCTSGFCVDGVCCDSKCDQPCHYCAFPWAPGVCSPSPAGLDRRGSCGSASSCQRTCAADGSCVAAGAGAQCAPARCTGLSQGVGPAVCSATGSPCGEQAPFDCAPFACDSAFGACVGACHTSQDCSPGNSCDVSSGKCVPATAASSGGCAIGTSSAGSPALGTGALLGAALAIARRRRRRIG